MLKGKALLAAALAGFVVLGLQAPAHAKTAESDTRLAVVNTAKVEFPHLATVTVVTAKATTTVTVVPGNTLSGLAEAWCGDWHWQTIYNDNKDVVGANPDLIYPGQRLVINCAPDGAAAALPAPAAPAPVPAAAPASSGWTNPAPGACITSPFGWAAGRSYSHQGIDLGASYGSAIHAAASGTVYSTSWDNGGGNMTVLYHGGSLYTVYMHQSKFLVSPGQHVNVGDVIGLVGQTGDATGPHLHFEVQPWGVWGGRTDPYPYMRDRGVVLGC